MSSKKGRKSLDESGSGGTYSDLDELKQKLAEETEGAPEAESGPESGAGSGPGDDTGDTADTEADAPAGESGGSGGRTRMTFHIDDALAERLRDAVYHTPSNVTLSGTARKALRAAVEQIESQYNGGERFPPRDEELRGGRPIE